MRPQQIIDDVIHYQCGNVTCDRADQWLPETEFSPIYVGRKSECKDCAAKRMRAARRAERVESKRGAGASCRFRCKDCGAPTQGIRCTACRLHASQSTETRRRDPWWSTVVRPSVHDLVRKLERGER